MLSYLITLHRFSVHSRRVNMIFTVEVPAECTRLVLQSIRCGKIVIGSNAVNGADKSKIHFYVDDENDISPSNHSDLIVPFAEMHLVRLDDNSWCTRQLSNRHLQNTSMIIGLLPDIRIIELIDCWIGSFVSTAAIDVIRVNHCALENAFINNVKSRVEVDVRGLSAVQIAQVPSQLLFLRGTNRDAGCQFIVDDIDVKSKQTPPPLEHFQLSLCSDRHSCDMYVSKGAIFRRDVSLRNGAKCEWRVPSDVDIDENPTFGDDASNVVE